MRKMNLIAAAGLALLAGAAQAQVTLYGNLDVSVAYSKTKVGNDSESTTAVESSHLVDSYIGFKGNEDLGGGLKALFTLESDIGVDTGTAGTRFWGRNAYVGLAGGFGTVKLGNQESLFKTEGNAFSAFGGSSLLSTTGLFTGSLLGGSWQNTVGYASPNLSGLTISGQYSAKENAKGTPTEYSGGAYAAAANYAAGPFAASVTFGEVKSTDGTTNVADKNQAYLLGASYDFGVAKAFAQYGRNKVTTKNVSGDETDKFYQVGAIVPVSEAGGVHASYGQLKGEDYKDQMFSVAYNHSLSKRTGAYAGLVYNKFKLTGFDDVKTTAVTVGIRHAF